MAEESIPMDTQEGTEIPDETSLLRESLAKAEQQREEALRTLADYENSRKRAQREMENERKFAQQKFAGDLLPALDNLDRAVSAAKQAGETGPLIAGVTATLSQLLNVLQRFGITKIESQGQPFNPNLHEAVKMEPTNSQPPNTVLTVLQQGFMIHDRVLRPAAVIVAVSPS